MKKHKFLFSIVLLATIIFSLDVKKVNATSTVTSQTDQYEAVITVKKDLSHIVSVDSYVTIGEEWNPRDNFSYGEDEEGRPLSFEKLTIETDINVYNYGIYHVLFSYRNCVSVSRVYVGRINDTDGFWQQKTKYAAINPPILLNANLFEKVTQDLLDDLDDSGGSTRYLKNEAYYLSGNLLFGREGGDG